MPERFGETDYDFSSAISAAEHYRASTGFSCMVIDVHGEVRPDRGQTKPPNAGSRVFKNARPDGGQAEPVRFAPHLSADDNSPQSDPNNRYDYYGLCSYLFGPDAARQLCRKTHLYGSYQSEKFGGRYHYFCPASLLHWVSPIMYDGRMQGALVAGPALLFDQEELIRDIAEGRFVSHVGDVEVRDQIDPSLVRRMLADIPDVDPDRAHSLAELLYYTAASVSDESRRLLNRYSESLTQQSRISEHMQHIKRLEAQETVAGDYPIARERDLLKLIARGDKQRSQEVLNEILGYVFFATGRDFSTVKSRVLELIVILSRAAVKGGADIDQIFGLNDTYLAEINHFRSVEDLAFWLSRIMDRFTDLVFDLQDVRHTDAIYKAVRFMDERYGEKITLEDVAEEVNFSPAYFSKLFRREIGKTFVRYLNEVRIDRSKVLLRHRTIALADVAGMVGYEDQSYFTKVFKKFTGVPPGRYRETWRRYPAETYEIHEDIPKVI